MGQDTREPVFRIEVSESSSLSDPFTWQITENDGRPLVTIAARALVGTDLLPQNQSKTKSTLAELILNIVAYFVTAGNPEEVLDAIIRKESAFSRAIDFTGFHVSIENITDLYCDRISAWCDGSLPEYTPQRDSAWQSGKWRERKAQDPTPKEFRTGEIPSHIKNTLLDRKATKQSEIQTLSLIRTTLWDDAVWRATAYICPPEGSPMLVWIFGHKGPALKIIQGLKEDLTTEDKNDRLRVAIIRGIDRANPHHYRIVLTSNMTGLKSGAKFFAITSKSITMTASSDVNLDGFLSAFERFGAFFIAAGSIEDENMGPPEIFFEHVILKKQLIVKWARDIGVNDQDAIGIFSTDDPILSTEYQAPVMKLLEWKRSRN